MFGEEVILGLVFISPIVYSLEDYSSNFVEAEVLRARELDRLYSLRIPVSPIPIARLFLALSLSTCIETQIKGFSLHGRHEAYA